MDGFPKQRKRQKQTDSSDKAAEQKAQAFGQPAAAKKKQSSRQQAEAASVVKEKSSAAANDHTDALPPATQCSSLGANSAQRARTRTRARRVVSATRHTRQQHWQQLGLDVFGRSTCAVMTAES